MTGAAGSAAGRRGTRDVVTLATRVAFPPLPATVPATVGRRESFSLRTSSFSESTAARRLATSACRSTDTGRGARPPATPSTPPASPNMAAAARPGQAGTPVSHSSWLRRSAYSPLIIGRWPRPTRSGIGGAANRSRALSSSTSLRSTAAALATRRQAAAKAITPAEASRAAMKVIDRQPYEPYVTLASRTYSRQQKTFVSIALPRGRRGTGVHLAARRDGRGEDKPPAGLSCRRAQARVPALSLPLTQWLRRMTSGGPAGS